MLFRKNKIKPSSPKNYSYRESGNRKEKWFEKHGTTSDWAAVVIGILVAWFTIKLFFQTQCATEAAIKAANVADSTLNETRKQFKISNEPYLLASIDNISTRDTVRAVNFIMGLENIGSYPVKIKDYWVAAAFGKQWIKFNEAEKIATYISWGDSTGYYITKDKPFNKPMGIIMGESTYQALKNKKGGFFITIIGEINYENLVTDSIKLCRFEIQIQPFAPNYNELLLNDNIP